MSAPITVATTVAQDTTKGAAYVARPDGPPDTSSYLYGGWAVGLAVLLGYTLLLVRRMSAERRSPRA